MKGENLHTQHKQKVNCVEDNETFVLLHVIACRCVAQAQRPTCRGSPWFSSLLVANSLSWKGGKQVVCFQHFRRRCFVMRLRGGQGLVYQIGAEGLLWYCFLSSYWMSGKWNIWLCSARKHCCHILLWMSNMGQRWEGDNWPCSLFPLRPAVLLATGLDAFKKGWVYNND